MRMLHRRVFTPGDYVQGVLNAFSLPFVLLSRRWGTWGDRYLGGGFVFGLFIPVILFAFSAPMIPGRGALLLAFPVMLIFLVIHAAHRHRREHACYSEYAGTYWFQKGDSPSARKWALFKNELIGLPIFIGLGLLSPMLGLWLVMSLLADGLNLYGMINEMKERIRKMDDARITHEYLMRIYREPRHGW